MLLDPFRLLVQERFEGPALDLLALEKLGGQNQNVWLQSQVAYAQYVEEPSDWLKRNRARLVVSLIGKYVGARALEVLEVGAGIGQNVPSVRRLGPVDVEEINVQALAQLLRMPEVRTVFSDPIPFTTERTYDVVCALDVVEHLLDDKAAIAWFMSLLRRNGLLVITAPAYQWLFSDHDVALGHYRRYTKQGLLRALPSDGSSTVLQAGYFNSFLFPLAVTTRAAWSLSRLVAGDKISTKQPSPRNRWVDRIFGSVLATEVRLARAGARLPFGLSVYVVVRRTGISP